MRLFPINLSLLAFCFLSACGNEFADPVSLQTEGLSKSSLGTYEDAVLNEPLVVRAADALGKGALTPLRIIEQNGSQLFEFQLSDTAPNEGQSHPGGRVVFRPGVAGIREAWIYLFDRDFLKLRILPPAVVVEAKIRNATSISDHQATLGAVIQDFPHDSFPQDYQQLATYMDTIAGLSDLLQVAVFDVLTGEIKRQLKSWSNWRLVEVPSFQGRDEQAATKRLLLVDNDQYQLDDIPSGNAESLFVSTARGLTRRLNLFTAENIAKVEAYAPVFQVLERLSRVQERKKESIRLSGDVVEGEPPKYKVCGKLGNKKQDDAWIEQIMQDERWLADWLKREWKAPGGYQRQKNASDISYQICSLRMKAKLLLTLGFNFEPNQIMPKIRKYCRQ